jgi:hypothetical protein
MIEFIRRWLGNDVASRVGPPTGKTGNQLTEDDFSGASSALACEGGPEFVEFCVSNGSYEIEGDVLEKFKAVLAKYPVEDDDEYDHFAVVVRDGLISHGLLPEGDPQRYQYKVAQWAPLMMDQT